MSPFPMQMPAPDLPNDLEWLNTSAPLDWRDLRGKFVLLDFWTYCCINCMHILPELAKLEEAYPNELVVIGVHSAKFSGERETANIREAVQRYEIRHPVINDHDMRLWRRFGVSAWPTLVLIDPVGRIVWARSGEQTFETLDSILRKAIPYYRRQGILDERPIYFSPESEHLTETPLRFPGKVIYDASSERLFIADSNHHRIVVTRADGRLLEIVGCGRKGRQDGSFETAEFSHPQGMTLLDGALYIADTENHLIRKVDWQTRRVSTVAGTGEQARSQSLLVPGKATSVALNSPWDLYAAEERIFVAMAGAHQIWLFDPGKGRIGPYAGNGREDIVDGPLLPPRPYLTGYSSFAQPSGLSADGRSLYVADSEGSSIRIVPLNGRGDVQTLLGTAHLPSARLFTFGDVDGPFDRARLQHPLGVVYHEGKVYVADTYNDKIKVIDPSLQSVRTIAGNDASLFRDPPARFNEPAGLALGPDCLFVADTNNHVIRKVSLQPPYQVTTLEIQGLTPPAPAADGVPKWAEVAQREATLLPETVVAKGKAVPIRLLIDVGPTIELNPQIPIAVETCFESNEGKLLVGPVFKLSNAADPVSIVVPDTVVPRRLLLQITCFWCDKGSRVCRMTSRRYIVPVTLAQDAGPATVTIDVALP
ncbi:thioredoxin-like domain-containing protein [Thermostilla marina]